MGAEWELLQPPSRRCRGLSVGGNSGHILDAFSYRLENQVKKVSESKAPEAPG